MAFNASLLLALPLYHRASLVAKMVLRDWSELPIGAKKLIIYYSISSIPLSIYVFFPIYMYLLGFSLELVGLLFTIYYLLMALSKYIVGKLLDIKISPKICIIVIDSLAVIEYIIYSLASAPVHFIIAFVLDCIASPFFVAYRTIEKDLYPSDKLEIAYRHHMFWPYISQLFSIIIMGIYLWILNDPLSGMRQLFQFNAILHSLIVLYVIRHIPDTSEKVLLKTEKKRSSAKIFRGPLLFLSIAEIVIITGYFITPSFIFLNYLFNVLGFTIITITFIEAFDTGFRGLASILHKRIEKHKKLSILMISLVISSLAGILIFITQYVRSHLLLLVLIVVSLIFLGLGESLWWIQHEAIFLKYVPEDRRGEVFGTISSIRSIINILTPMVSAYIASKIHPLAPFLLYAILLLSSIPIYTISLKKTEFS